MGTTLGAEMGTKLFQDSVKYWIDFWIILGGVGGVRRGPSILDPVDQGPGGGVTAGVNHSPEGRGDVGQGASTAW